MATSTAFGYNTGSTITGTKQIGNLAVVTATTVNYSPTTNGGVTFWMGPDEDLGYVIATPVPVGNQPTPIVGVTAFLGFYRSQLLTDESFLSLANHIGNQSGQSSFVTTNDAVTWLNNNGYYTSYTGSEEEFFILTQSGDIITAQNGNGIEYQH